MDQNVDLVRGKRKKMYAASMSSSPLFIKVAESIVTFAPIDQLGC